MIASIWWITTAGTYEIERVELAPINPYLVGAGQVPLWVLQSIAAAPLRDGPAPPAVYALMLFPFVALVGTAVVKARPRLRVAILTVCLVSLAVP